MFDSIPETVESVGSLARIAARGQSVLLRTTVSPVQIYLRFKRTRQSSQGKQHVEFTVCRLMSMYLKKEYNKVAETSGLRGICKLETKRAKQTEFAMHSHRV